MSHPGGSGRNFDDDESSPLLTPTKQPYSMSNDPPSETSAVDQPQPQEEAYQQGGEQPQQPHENAPTAYVDVDERGEVPPNRGGPTVTCRVCEAEIPLEGRTTQHVVRCLTCNEVTPIRAAPPGKKYVRCPCNCLLVCKASSNRIACPRANCRRVITLVASAPVGTAVRAPAGTCRVQCCYCMEMFMFNTLANQVANCPHCKKSSSVGARYARSKSLIFFVCSLISLILAVGITMAMWPPHVLAVVLWIGLYALTVFFIERFVYFMRLKISQVLGPI